MDIAGPFSHPAPSVVLRLGADPIILVSCSPYPLRLHNIDSSKLLDDLDAYRLDIAVGCCVRGGRVADTGHRAKGPILSASLLKCFPVAWRTDHGQGWATAVAASSSITLVATCQELATRPLGPSSAPIVVTVRRWIPAIRSYVDAAAEGEDIVDNVDLMMRCSIG